MRQLPVITTSSGRCYRRCAREYQLRIELGYSAVTRAGALQFGSATHTGIEHLLTGGWDADAAISKALTGVDDPFDAAKIEVMLRGYSERWKNEPLEVIAVECEFRAPLVNPATNATSKTWEQAGKLDALVRDQSGAVLIVEHKTSSDDVSTGSPYWEKLRLDSQISTYYNGARALGYEPAGVIYDVLRKPQIKQLKATPVERRTYKKTGELYANQREFDETPAEFKVRIVEKFAEEPDAYFMRGEIVRLESEEHEAAQDVWQLALFIRESQRSNRWPRNPEACERYGRMCDFWPVCTKSASLDDTSRYTVTKAHQELEQVA